MGSKTYDFDPTFVNLPRSERPRSPVPGFIVAPSPTRIKVLQND
ncbi:hypothetical protein [Lyngbya sp. CCY1209]|nr:hypothetical protein [Lyngbya sp. CCY1209]